jgi:hypothetical protein
MRIAFITVCSSFVPSNFALARERLQAPYIFEVMLPSACSFIVDVHCLTFSFTLYTTCFGLHGHLQVCMMFYFYIPEGICFAVFVEFSCTWLYFAHFYLWGGLNMMYYYLLFIKMAM